MLRAQIRTLGLTCLGGAAVHLVSRCRAVGQQVCNASGLRQYHRCQRSKRWRSGASTKELFARRWRLGGLEQVGRRGERCRQSKARREAAQTTHCKAALVRAALRFPLDCRRSRIAVAPTAPTALGRLPTLRAMETRISSALFLPCTAAMQAQEVLAASSCRSRPGPTHWAESKKRCCSVDLMRKRLHP